MVKIIWTIVLLCGTAGSLAKIDDELFGPNGSAMLKELKDSGVIDQFEKELEKMLHEKAAQEKPGGTETETESEPGNDAGINPV